MKRIPLILALVLITSLAFSNLIATQKWLKKHGKTYTIKQLKKLKVLSLDYTKVSNITPLKGLKNLEGLNLFWTQVRDVSPLKGLKNLTELDLRGTKVSKKDVLALKKALPKCKISSDYK